MNQMLSSVFSRCVLGAALGFPALVSSSFGQVVTPISTEGSGASSIYPFVNSSFGGQASQFLLEQSKLGALAPGDIITGISFRAEGGGSGSLPASTLNYTDFEIRLGKAATTAETMSTTFASNFQSSTLVKDGAFSLPPNSFPRGSTPNPFGFVITFDTPFTYTGGDLVIETRTPGSSVAIPVDVDATAGSGFGTTYNGIRFLGDANATLANSSAGVPIMQLTYTPVPEPASFALAGGIALGAFAFVRKLKK